MASWVWDLQRVPGERNQASVEHDGRVVITVGDEDVDDDRSITLDADDFEEMCKSFLERMVEWRARTGEVPRG